MDLYGREPLFRATPCGTDASLLYTPKQPKETCQKTDRGCFFSLPIEIRNLIYFLILAPCSEGEVGTTKILSLCKQTYEEAIRYLEPCIPIFQLGARHGSTLFRDPRANGKPNLYSSSIRSSSCYVYPRFSQIEVVKARSMLISMFQVNDLPFRKEPDILVHLKELIDLLNKTTRMQILIICIDWWQRDNTPELRQVLILCRELLAVCQHKDIKVVLQYPSAVKLAPLSISVHAEQLRVGSNALLDAFQWWAESLNMQLDSTALDKSPYENTIHSHDPFWSRYKIYQKSDILYGPALCTPNNDDISLLASSLGSIVGYKPSKEHSLFNLPGFYHPNGTTTPYSKTPECRSCYAIFPTEAGLQTHLWEFGSHRQAFRRKRWNPVASYIHSDGVYYRGSGGRVCWTCGWQFASLVMLNKHLDNRKHRRFGIVPRYVEDNEKFNRKWELHKKNYKWL